MPASTKCEDKKISEGMWSAVSPALGMYEQAVKNYDIDLSHSWTIGDKPRDLLIMRENGMQGIFSRQVLA